MKKLQIKLRSLSLTAATTALLFAALPAWAVAPFKLKDIRVEGLQRVEPGTVFASLPFRIGEQYSDDKGSTAIRSLFGLGLFSDVKLQVEGDVLVVIVEERPSVADVSFSGIKEFDAEVLKKSLRDVGLAEGLPFDKALLDRAEQELKRQYIDRSMYAAQVTTTVTPGERNRVNLSFSVVEGDVAKIKEIRIVGNKAVSESTLRDLLNLDTGGLMSWYTKSNRYSRPKLNADLENLRSYYLTRGYLEFRVDSTQVAMSPDKQDMLMTINITEGNRFVVSSVALEGEYLGKDDEFKSLVSMRVGEAFDAEDVSKTVKAFTDYFGSFGYAFAQIDATPKIDRATNQVAFILRAQPSRRAYVRRINVVGNSRTRDEVVRREFRQLESAWYDSDRIRLSRDRVDRLGYFTEVGITTEPVPGTNDQVDLTITVAEKPTGNLSIGAGYSQSDKLSFIGSIKQDNVFGSGNYLGLDVNTSSYNRNLVLSTTDPYFTGDGISRTLDAYYKTTRPYDSQGGDYEISTPGVGIKFGVPVSERDTVFFGIGAERVKVTSGNQLPEAYLNQSGTYIPATIGWARDERDSALVPTTGRLQRLNTELGAGGTHQYVKVNYQFQQYLPLTSRYTLAFNTEFGLGKGLGSKDFPVLRNFYGGGLGSVRGFEQGTLGPSSAVIGSTSGETVSVGGARKLVANLEFIAPFPGAGNDRTLRWFGFMDVGNVYGESESIDLSKMRSSVGVGLSWISPIGPLRFAYATPIRKFDGDQIQKFQFQIGTSF